MKYVRKLPATDRQLSNQLIENGWKKIKEPRNFSLAVLFSLPFSYLLGSIILWLAYLLKPTLFEFLISDVLSISFSIDFKMLLYILFVFVYMLIHELIHAVFIPNFTKSKKIFFGLNGLFGFVFTTEPIKKERFLVISIMPFFLLSLVPVFLLNLLGFLNWYTLGLCLINAVGSCVDFLNMFLIAFQVKSGHTIINNGFETYYYPMQNIT
ncbi:hypothetical protein CS063_02285 [Sporanaerobium hydrogeniformans]|uniref:Uncharacterized protein n=1 Tax=Sporanaerobium hydrogeniformans TaxID=3072179 RepID=A0AC61DHQ6_9FIRM|nr:DUF3267 domain-containing protein [Sporanaerobium hydrogeniformans]PHV72325.1 hypothetical protein CS063_02285 [Sporanaerobium hydrogeniformans]